MNVFEEILQKAVPDLENVAKTQLLKGIEGIGFSAIGDHIAQAAVKSLLKGADEVVATFVKALPAEKTDATVKGYAEEVDNLLYTFGGDFLSYCEAQLAVEAAKKQFGNHSKETDDARAKRATLHDEVVNSFKAAFEFVIRAQIS